MSLGAFSGVENYCINCSKKIGKNAERCRHCNNTSRKLPPNKCIDCGAIILRGSKRCQICCYKDPTRNQKLSEARIADWKTGKYNTDEYRSNLSKGQKVSWTPARREEKSDWFKMAYATGILGTEGHRQNLSTAGQKRADSGEYQTEEWCRKISEGVSAWYAKVGGHSEEWKEQHSIDMLLAWERGDFGEEWRKSLSNAIIAAWERGAYDSDNTRQRMSDARKESHARGDYGEEWHQNLSIARRKQYGDLERVVWSEYGFEFDCQLKQQIRERDSYTCQLCNCIETLFNHSVHHINYQKSDSRPENLITLCRSCHQKTNFNRPYWTTLFHLEILYIYGERIENGHQRTQ